MNFGDGKFGLGISSNIWQTQLKMRTSYTTKHESKSNQSPKISKSNQAQKSKRETCKSKDQSDEAIDLKRIIEIGVRIVLFVVITETNIEPSHGLEELEKCVLNWQAVLLPLFSVVFHDVDCGGGEGRGTEDLNYILL